MGHRVVRLDRGLLTPKAASRSLFAGSRGELCGIDIELSEFAV